MTINVQYKQLHYDYDDQCWIKNGIVLKCGHREKVPLCFSCSHHGEEHYCTEDCLEQVKEKA